MSPLDWIIAILALVAFLRVVLQTSDMLLIIVVAVAVFLIFYRLGQYL